MWKAYSIILRCQFENVSLASPIDISCGILLEPVPDWVKNDAALSQLSRADQEGIRNATLSFSSEYETSGLWMPDPNWNGRSPRSIQHTIDEKFSLATLAFWLAKPTPLTTGPVLHFARIGDPGSLRYSASLRSMLVSDQEEINALSCADISKARELLRAINSLDRASTSWIALRTLIRAVSERFWEARFLFEWIALEALFGTESTSETTHRLAQRIGIFVGNSPEDRKQQFLAAKRAYSWRSKIVHGSKLAKLSSENSVELATFTERILRTAMNKILLTPSLLEKFDSIGRENFLDDLVFQITQTTPPPATTS